MRASRALRPFRFIGLNSIYIMWFILYFTIAWVVLGVDLYGFILAAIIYGTSVSVALSPFGEVLLRILENCREPATEEETSYLLPIFEEVFEDAKEIDPNLNDGIKIYIKDTMFLDSYALGRKTIVVTKGAIATFAEDELKGMIARELGNMSYGHTKAKLLTRIGNFFFTAIVWLLKMLLNVLLFINNAVRIRGIKGIIITILIHAVRFIFNANVFIFITISEIILSINSRANESQADAFAYDMGYGRELISALYLLQKISITGEASLLERAKAAHFHIAFRIRDLEALENQELED